MISKRWWTVLIVVLVLGSTVLLVSAGKPAQPPLPDQGPIGDLLAKITALEAQVAQLTTEKATLQAQVTQLTADKADLQSQVSQLTATNAALLAEVDGLKADNEGLSMANSQLGQENAELGAEVGELTSQVGSLSAVVEFLSQQNEGYQFDIQMLNVQLGDANQAVEMAEDALTDCQIGYSFCQQDLENCCSSGTCPVR